MPHVEAKINLALEIHRDGKAWPNSADPEALETNLHFSGNKHPFGQGLEPRGYRVHFGSPWTLRLCSLQNRPLLVVR